MRVRARVRVIITDKIRDVNMKNNEKYLERKLTREVKKIGGISIKFTSVNFTGVPDRIILLPGGTVRFAEIKTEGAKLSKRQEHVKGKFEKLGIKVAVIKTEEELERFIDGIQST